MGFVLQLESSVFTDPSLVNLKCFHLNLRAPRLHLHNLLRHQGKQMGRPAFIFIVFTSLVSGLIFLAKAEFF